MTGDLLSTYRWVGEGEDIDNSLLSFLSQTGLLCWTKMFNVNFNLQLKKSTLAFQKMIQTMLFSKLFLLRIVVTIKEQFTCVSAGVRVLSTRFTLLFRTCFYQIRVCLSGKENKGNLPAIYI